MLIFQENLLHTLLCAGLSQLNHYQNYMGRMLDLVFSNDPGRITIVESDILLIKIDMPHDPLEIFLQIFDPHLITPGPSFARFNFSKADFNALNHLGSIDWYRRINLCADCDSAVDIFYEVFRNGFNEYVPKKSVVGVSHPPWYTPKLSKLKNKKNKAHANFQTTKNASVYTAYSLLRKNVIELELQSTSYREYLTKTRASLSNDPSKFWSYVSSKKKTSGYPSVT